ncbi:MAG: transposase, partial [Alphaproteobacteria bacterium]|nr:transposase [Alphaproteobacteria bacterium]
MDLESRLVRCYHQLVKSHMSINNLLTAGIKSTLEGNEAFNQTQAAWSFFNNERCELTELIKPIKDSALNQSE